jgi:preprotein translocase subunit YajC
MSLLVPLVLFGLLWAFLVLPQQRRMRAQQEMQNSLQPGDEVVTAAGIYGRVSEVESDSLLVEVAPGIELRMARSAIGRRLPPEEADALAEGEGVDEFDVDLDGDTVPGAASVDEFDVDLDGDTAADDGTVAPAPAPAPAPTTAPTRPAEAGEPAPVPPPDTQDGAASRRDDA